MKLHANTKLAAHRNLFNGDCTFLFGDWPQFAEKSARFDVGVIHRFVALLGECGVDTYLCNPNAQLPWYPSRALPHVLSGYRRGDRAYFRGHFPPTNDTDFTVDILEKRLNEMANFFNNYLDLMEDGIDWVAEIAKACRANNISPWLSVRMNDAHGANSWEGSHMNCALQNQAKFRLSGRAPNPRDGVIRSEMLLNYEHREVREYYFAMIRELVEEYDYEGLELDWTRIPACCEPEASPSTCRMMVDWIAQVRELTNRHSEKTGKPYPLGLRTPVRLGQLKTIGLDVPQMTREGLIDFLCPTNTWQTTWDVPHEDMRRDLGDEVAIFGVVENAPNWMNAYSPQYQKTSHRLLSTSPELLRGNAAGKLATGAHGIETFNFFCSDDNLHDPSQGTQKANYPALRDLHDLEKLRGRPKHYCFASQQGYFLNPLYEYGEQIPFVLRPGWKRSLHIAMCAEPESTPSLTLQVIVEDQENLPGIGVSFNGSWPNFESERTDALVFPTGILTHHVADHVAFNFQFSSTRIKEGWNEILIYNDARDGANEYSICIVGVELAVR